MRFAIPIIAALSIPAQASLEAVFTAGEASDRRVDRLPALSVPAGQAAAAFLPAGPFEVEWTGNLVVPRRQRLVFSFEGEGAATLTIAGNEVLSLEGDLAAERSAQLRLNPGEHEFVLRYRSAEDGSAGLRVYWEEAGFPRQTIPPSAFAEREPAAETKVAELARHGRLAFTQQHCAKCHTPESGLGAGAMPETGEIGPVLVGIGDRVSEEWLRQWIAKPAALKPGTHMPALVDVETEEGRGQAADLAAYLATLKLGLPVAAEPAAELARAGGVVFHELGCASCHSAPDREGGPDLDGERVPLSWVAAKYEPGALAEFLKRPDAYHPFTGMPNFALSEDEAASLAAYLREASTGNALPLEVEFPEGDPARGQELVVSLHCGNCHPGLLLSGEAAGPSLEDVFRADWAEAGCVSESDTRETLPILNLPGERREALVAFSQAEAAAASLGRDSQAEFAARRVDAMNCVACHALDDQQALWDSVRGETFSLVEHLEGLGERVDQSRPQLTFMGEMLFTDYIESMLKGTTEPEPRPWLAARMPAFPAHASTFAEALSRWHGFEPSGPVAIETDPEMVAIGRDLVGTAGFGCNTCHMVEGAEATAAFEVEGIALDESPRRLREEYYHRWMDNPQAVIPSTKMPRYSDGTRSQRGDVLDGDARAQFDAIWQYLHSIRTGAED